MYQFSSPTFLQAQNRRIRQGQAFELLLVVGVLFVLIQGYLLLSQHQTNKTEYGSVGQTARALSASPGMSDDVLLYLHEAATISLHTTLSEIGRRGAMGDTETCGITNGYSLWNTVDKRLDQCVPLIEDVFPSLFLQNLNTHLATYTTPFGKAKDLSRHFDLGFHQTDTALLVTGTTPEPLTLSLTKADGELAMTTRFYPSFRISMPDLSTEISQLKEGAGKIIIACASALSAFECSQQQAYIFNTAPQATLKWKTGPCAGDLAPPDPRIVQFCVEAPRRVLTHGVGGGVSFYPMLYRFALTIASQTQVKILQFQANNNPPSGSPADKGGISLNPGAQLRYQASVTSPDLDGLFISLCFIARTHPSAHPLCLDTPPAEWNTESFSQRHLVLVSSSMQPPVQPPFTLLLKANRKNQQDVTAGIDVVELTVPLPASGLTSAPPTPLNP